MSTRDLIQEALHSLEANKGRSLLTILGIVIGIASVIAMTSLIGGIQNSLVNSLGLNAARMVQIYSSQELTDSDIQKLQKLVPQIEQIGIVDSAYTEYKSGDKSYTVMAQGVDSDMLVSIRRVRGAHQPRRRRSALRQRTGRTGENHQGVQR